MLDCYEFRFALSEICTMPAVLYFLMTVFPCRRSKKIAVLIAYAAMTVYITIMFITGADISSDGAIYRGMLLITQHIFLPWYLIGDRSWYRYIGIAVMGDLGSSCFGSVLFTPVYYLMTGNSSLDFESLNGDIYSTPGKFYVLVAFVIVNNLAYFLVTRLLCWIMKKEKRKKRLLDITMGCFIIVHILLGIILLPKGKEILIEYFGVVSIFTEGLGLLLIIRGLIWEKTVDAKNREMIQIRESIQYEKYIKIQEKQQRARKILHDFADHMTTVQLLLDKGDIKKAKSYVNSYDFKG